MGTISDLAAMFVEQSSNEEIDEYIEQLTGRPRPDYAEAIKKHQLARKKIVEAAKAEEEKKASELEMALEALSGSLNEAGIEIRFEWTDYEEVSMIFMVDGREYCDRSLSINSFKAKED